MTAKKRRLLLGAHMSISGGLEKSIERGELIGCTTIQIFTKSNRQWNARPLTIEEIEVFKKTASRSSVNPIVAHATYLINLASPDSKTENASRDALTKELIVCAELGIPYIVLHPGSYVVGNPLDGLQRIIENLDYAREESKSNSIIALETMAGQGSSLCATFEQLATIIKGSRHKEQLGVCLDTCHIFAAGYDTRTKNQYDAMWNEFDTIIGLEKLKVIHINDSKKGLGSHVDRHEHIGKGQLGLEPFRLLFNDPRFFDIPKILETPKDEAEPYTDDKENMATIYSLLSEETKKLLNVDLS